MNILILWRDFKYKNIPSGTSMYCYEYSKNLAFLGNNIHIITSSKKKNEPEYELVEKVHVHRFFVKFTNPLLGYLYRLWKYYEMFNRLEKNIKFDLINLHTPGIIIFLQLNKNFRRVPLVYIFHAPRSYEIRYDLFKELSYDIPLKEKLLKILKYLLYYYKYMLTERIDLKYATKIIVMSKYMKSLIKTLYGNIFLEKAEIIPIGVDTKKFIPARNKKLLRMKMNLDEKQVIFFTLRRLEPRMGLENLIFGFNKILHKTDRKLLFFIGGEGHLKTRLETLIKKLKLNNCIRLLGFLNDERKLLYYQIADAFVLPTEDLEGFGIVTLEALSCNLPVIATPAGGTPEILSKLGNDLISKSVSIDSISEKLIYFLNNYDKSTQTGVYRRFAIEEYDWEKIGLDIEHSFEDVCE